MEQGASFISSEDNIITDLIESMRILRLTKRLYRCNVCKLRFAKVIELVDHMQVHSVRPYQCKECKKVYQSLVACRQHVFKEHIHLSRYTCPYCLKNYRRYANYYKHLIEHVFFECDICHEKFYEYRILFEHCVINHIEKVDEKIEEFKRYIRSLRIQERPN